MPLATHGYQPYSTEKAMVYPYSSGAPGTGVNLPILSASGDPQVTESEHRGNNRVIASIRTLDSYDMSLTIPEWDLAAIAVVCGGVVTETGTTPAQVRTLTHASTDNPPPFGLKVQAPSKSADGGAVRLVFPNCQQANPPNYGFDDQEFRDLEVTTSAIHDATGVVVKVQQWETADAAMTSTWADAV